MGRPASWRLKQSMIDRASADESNAIAFAFFVQPSWPVDVEVFVEQRSVKLAGIYLVFPQRTLGIRHCTSGPGIYCVYGAWPKSGH